MTTETFDMKPEYMKAVVSKRAKNAKAHRPKPGVELQAPSNSRPLLAVGDTLASETYTIASQIGSGGFGQIYAATSKDHPDEVVIVKTGHKTRDKDTARMHLEIEVMFILNSINSKHCPRMYASGEVLDHEPPYNFIVMQLLSKNLAEARRASPTNYLSFSTCIRLWSQMLSGIKDMHSTGYLHRDIKPSNMAMGLQESNKNTLFLIDFGLVRQFVKPPELGKMRPEREKAGFRGTQRYVSMRVHNRKDQCRTDDIIGLFYTFLELLTGGLPWKSHKDPDKILAGKQSLRVDEIVPAMPQAIMDSYTELKMLGYHHEPRYEHYIKQAEEALVEVGGKETDLWDWESPGFGTVVEELEMKNKKGVLLRQQ